MLRVGLTGGIGAGKSTAARRLATLGAVLVDADVVAREVVQPGTLGLAELVSVFGDQVLTEDGELDRPAMAAVVFNDDAARRRLNDIVHPLVRRRTEELVAAAPRDALVVQDIPLLVEGGMAPSFALTVVVDAPESQRVHRLVKDRGMSPDEARARIAAQASEQARRAAADVWLDNSGRSADLAAQVDRLWQSRLLPFEYWLRKGRPRPTRPRLVEPDPSWPAQFERVAVRVSRAAAALAQRVDHIGSTSVPCLPARDVLDIQLSVADLGAVHDLVDDLRAVGFVYRPELRRDVAQPSGPAAAPWPEGVFVSADPGRAVDLHVRATGSPGWRMALLLRDWLRAVPEARSDYASLTRRLLAESVGDAGTRGNADAEHVWLDSASDAAGRWASATGWQPPVSNNVTELAAAKSQKV
jgi:dephospho-CoA kinase